VPASTPFLIQFCCTPTHQGTTLKASAAAPAAPAAPAPSAAAPAPQAGLDPEARSRAALDAALAGDDSPVQHRLARELFERRVPDFRRAGVSLFAPQRNAAATRCFC
jgi:hypothetical protein